MVVIWLFDSRGFISAVAYDPKKDTNKVSQFSEIAKQAGTHVLVRARILEDLDMLKTVVPNLHVETDKAADYSFRAVITRKQYKKFLVKAVDEITYDSHFKEAARDRSPKAEGRYSAMMKVWSAMATLQPFSPYGGFGGYSSTWSSGSSSSSKSKSSNIAVGVAKPKASEAEKKAASGYATMEEYLDNYLSHTKKGYLTGSGPRTGFKTGDQVEGHFGIGTVLDISPLPSTINGADLVRVEFERNGKEIQSVFVSNFIIPLALDMEEDMEEYVIPSSVNLAGALAEVLLRNDAVWPIERITELDDDGYEFVVRLQERIERGEVYSAALAHEVREEVMWEGASDDEKIELANEGTVPEKYAAEVSNLVASKS